MFGLLYGDLVDYPEAVKLAGTAGNLSLLARDGALLGTREGGWDNPGLRDTATLSGAVELTPDPTSGTATVVIVSSR